LKFHKSWPETTDLSAISYPEKNKRQGINAPASIYKIADPTAYNYEPFLRFMIKPISRALGDFEFYRKRYRDVMDLSPSATELHRSFKGRPENRFQRGLIIEDTAFPARPLPMPWPCSPKAGLFKDSVVRPEFVIT